MPCLSDALVRYQHARQPGMSRRLVEDTVPCFVAMGTPRVCADTFRAWLKQAAGDDASTAIRQHPRRPGRQAGGHSTSAPSTAPSMREPRMKEPVYRRLAGTRADGRRRFCMDRWLE